MMGSKLIRVGNWSNWNNNDNRPFRAMLRLYTRYESFIEVADHYGPTASAYVANFTNQDAYKEMQLLHQRLVDGHIKDVSMDEWKSSTKAVLESMIWIIHDIEMESEKDGDGEIKEWPNYSIVCKS